MRTVVRSPYGARRTGQTEVDVRWFPAIAVLAALVLVAPVWGWSRGWGWTPAAMVGVTLATIVLFTLSVVPA